MTRERLKRFPCPLEVFDHGPFPDLKAYGAPATDALAMDQDISLAQAAIGRSDAAHLHGQWCCLGCRRHTASTAPARAGALLHEGERSWVNSYAAGLPSLGGCAPGPALDALRIGAPARCRIVREADEQIEEHFFARRLDASIRLTEHTVIRATELHSWSPRCRPATLAWKSLRRWRTTCSTTRACWVGSSGVGRCDRPTRSRS